MNIITKIMKMSSTEYNIAIYVDKNLIKVSRIDLKTNKMVRTSNPLFDEDGIYSYENKLYMLSDDKTLVFESDGKKIIRHIKIEDFMYIVLHDIQSILIKTEKEIVWEREKKEREKQSEMHKNTLKRDIITKKPLTKDLIEERVAKRWEDIVSFASPVYIQPAHINHMENILSSSKIRKEHIVMVLLSKYQDYDEEAIRNAIDHVSMLCEPYEPVLHISFLLKTKNHYKLGARGRVMVKKHLLHDRDDHDE